MKLVIGLAVLLTLADDKVHGSIIGNYGGNHEGQGSELHNSFSQKQSQEEPKGEYNVQEQSLDYGGGGGGQEQLTDYGGQQQQGFGGQELDNNEPQINNEVSERSQEGEEGGTSGQWQSGFQASVGVGEGQQDHSALSALSEHLRNHEGEEVGGEHGFGGSELNSHDSDGHDSGNIANLASHGINLSGHDFEGQNDHPDLKPKVEVQHHHIPTRTIEHTKPVHIPVVKKIGVPVPHPVGVPTEQIIKVPVPQPYAVHIPVPHPISVPIYKLVPQEIEKKVPIVVEKLVPVYVDKPFKIEVEKHHVEYIDKPYAVHVPVYKHIYHHVSKHGSGGHSGGH
ncbi:uncharacterized protein [Leptinotarsa decemlineata]|uniref:uncharacterized protein n=1 Tax=Leptinotarsa decemlineata TaxID=7539 RepID=UPI003D30997A